MILTTKSTKNTKNQSTEDTEQTESLADVGHTAADFVPTGARRMKNIMMASVCSAVVHGRKMSCENSLRKTKKMNNSSAKKALPLVIDGKAF